MPNTSFSRLTKRSEYQRVAKEGKRFTTPGFILQVLRRSQEEPIRYGITASRKVGGAVDRNRAKRRLRALLRESLSLFGQPGVDYVFIARKAILTRNYALLREEVKDSLEKASP